MTKEQVNELLEDLAHTRSKTLRRLLVADYVRKYGDVLKAYRDAVNEAIEVYGGKDGQTT